MELIIDAVARAVGREPCDVRRDNLVPETAMPFVSVTGNTYDSVESIEEFFRKRTAQINRSGSPGSSRSALNAKRDVRAAGSGALNANKDVRASAGSAFLPGSYVRHTKYGRGLVLRREGSGDTTKLTVSFPGYGQKKLVQKYAGLEEA